MPTEINQIKIINPCYNVEVDQKGRIAVKGPNGKAIISGITYYAQDNDGKENWGLKNIFVNHINDSSIEVKGTGIKNELVYLLIITHPNNPKIDFKVKVRFNENTIINREALVALFNIPVSTVYKKNRKIDTTSFESEYWLQKEGVRFGNNENSALIYHTPSISSLQLEPQKQMLFINLDYDLDHPFVHLPYQQDAGGKWVNLSTSDYKAGSERDNSFSINIGPFPKSIPRLMLVPYGFKAGYIFTEHADGGNIRKQRAAYFGSEDINNAKAATGGFVAHHIPVTKSVFFTGPVTSPGASIYEGGEISPLLDFLDQLYATGDTDLCLHTPDDGTSNRQTLGEAIKFMKERYNAITWIDHGFYGGKINRESLVCDGLDSLSPYYAADLWEKYNTKYFWSPSVEMINNLTWVSVTDNIKRLKFYTAYISFLRHYASPDDLKQLSLSQLFRKLKTNYSYRQELNTLEYNSGSSLPTPIYWQSPTRTREFYSWSTNEAKSYGDLTEKEIGIEKKQLLNLIDHQGIFIDHGYFVRNAPVDRTLITKNGKLVINPNFDKILTIISQMRAKGDLYVTTVRDLLNYWISLEKVDFQYLPDGSVTLINNNDTPIKGLSLIVKGKTVLVDGKVPIMKHINDETIFWFDIGAHNQVKLETP
ncbi:MAG: hypothetical protein ABI208_06505 [Ginsengibacter sp.]